MKSIVVFYSRTGNTQLVAEEIANNLGSDLRPLIDRKNRKGLWGYLWAGFDAIMRNQTEIEKFEINLAQYDLIFLGCPNWVSQLPPALRTFLNTVNLTNKKMVLFCTQEGMGAEKVFSNLRLLAKGAEIIDEKYFNKVEKNKEATRLQVREWLNKFQPKADQPMADKV